MLENGVSPGNFVTFISGQSRITFWNELKIAYYF